MGRGKIALAKLPNIDDIAVEDEFFGLYTAQISDELVRLTPVSTQVHIRDYRYIYLPLFQVIRIYLQSKSPKFKCESILNHLNMSIRLSIDYRNIPIVKLKLAPRNELFQRIKI